MILMDIAQAKINEPTNPMRIKIEEDGIAELAESIKVLGLLQPIVVRPIDEHYEVVAGHRRLLATRMLGLDPVQCLVLDAEGDEVMVAQRLHENIFRRDLTPVEEAACYAELWDKLLDTDKVAAAVHRSRAVVERRLRILEMDDQVRDALSDGKIPLGVAEELSRITDETKRRYLLSCAITDGATTDKVRDWRKEFENIAFIREGDPLPGGPGALHEVPTTALSGCWLCGSAEDQHAMRVFMVHTYCERMWRNQQAAAAPAEAPNEQQ